MEDYNVVTEKTALGRLPFLCGTSAAAVCRELGITPQQFADWVKLRRPIPIERIAQLSELFGVPEYMIADEGRFSRRLDALLENALERAVVARKLEAAEGEDRALLASRAGELEAEAARRARLSRLARILEKADAAALTQIDAFLDELDK